MAASCRRCPRHRFFQTAPIVLPCSPTRTAISTTRRTSRMSQNMPFTYLQDFAPDTNDASGDNRDKDGMASAGASSSFASDVAGMDSSSFSGGVQFQMPSYLLPSSNGPMLGSEMFPAGFFQAGASSYYDRSLWTQPPMDKSKTYANSSKTYVVSLIYLEPSKSFAQSPV